MSHQVSLGHANARIDNGDSVVCFVRNDVNVQLWVALEHSLVGKALEADLVQCIGGIGDQLTQKDLLVGVECIDNQRQQLVDLSLKGKGLYFPRHGCKMLHSDSCKRTVQSRKICARKIFDDFTGASLVYIAGRLLKEISRKCSRVAGVT